MFFRARFYLASYSHVFSELGITLLLVLMFFSDRFYLAPCSHVFSDRFYLAPWSQVLQC